MNIIKECTSRQQKYDLKLLKFSHTRRFKGRLEYYKRNSNIILILMTCLFNKKYYYDETKPILICMHVNKGKNDRQTNLP